MRFGLYIHIPYCLAKCPYCDFNSYAADRWPEADYVAALCAEMKHYAGRPEWSCGSIPTIFFGGGTPSLFAPASIAQVLDTVATLWAIESGAEITLEANPGTLLENMLGGFRAAGVNRMSFGVQSFQSQHLARLGRIHSADEARQAVRWARAAGFDNVSLDLIYALPHQSLDEWRDDLREALALETDHISAYNLTYEEGTPFHAWRGQGRLKQLDEDLELAMFDETQERLANAGYAQYEISNYARPGRACRHNLNYWQYGGYLGVGAGAHSYAPVQPHGERWGNERNPARYMERASSSGAAQAQHEALNPRQAQGEFVFLALRCRDGFDSHVFERLFRLSFLQAFPHVEAFIEEGLVECHERAWRLTQKGLRIADTIFASFL